MNRGGGFAVRLRWFRGLILVGAAAFCLAGCAGAPRNPVPLALENQATVLGMGSSSLIKWLGRRCMPWFKPEANAR